MLFPGRKSAMPDQLVKMSYPNKSVVETQADLVIVEHLEVNDLFHRLPRRS
jgi:hypothetical protein